MIEAPQESIATLEQINNRITMAESEVRRLQGIKDSLSMEVDQLIKDRKWNESEKERLEGEIDEANKLVEMTAVYVAEAKVYTDNYEKLKVDHQKNIDALDADRYAHAKEVQTRTDALNEREKELAQKQAALDAAHESRMTEYYKSQTALGEREAKIKAFADSLR